MSIDEGVHYESSLDKVRIAYACYHDDYRVKGRTTEQWWGIRDKAMAEFDAWLEEIRADAWDEGYRDGHSDGLSDGHPLFNDREPEENPYREANDD